MMVLVVFVVVVVVFGVMAQSLGELFAFPAKIIGVCVDVAGRVATVLSANSKKKLVAVPSDHWLMATLCTAKREEHAAALEKERAESPDVSCEDIKAKYLSSLLPTLKQEVLHTKDEMKASRDRVVVLASAYSELLLPKYEPLLIEVALVHCLREWRTNQRSASEVGDEAVEFEAFLMTALEGEGAKTWFNCLMLIDTVDVLTLSRYFYKERIADKALTELISEAVIKKGVDSEAFGFELLFAMASAKNKAAADAWTAWLEHEIAIAGSVPLSKKDCAGLSILSELTINATHVDPDKRAYFPLGLDMKGVGANSFSDFSGVINVKTTTSEDDLMLPGFIYHVGELRKTSDRNAALEDGNDEPEVDVTDTDHTATATTTLEGHLATIGVVADTAMIDRIESAIEARANEKQLVVVSADHWLMATLCEAKRIEHAAALKNERASSPDCSCEEIKSKHLSLLLLNLHHEPLDQKKHVNERSESVVLLASAFSELLPECEPLLVEVALVHCIREWSRGPQRGSTNEEEAAQAFEEYFMTQLRDEAATKNWFDCQFILDTIYVLLLTPLFYKERVANQALRDLISISIVESRNDSDHFFAGILIRLALEENKAAAAAWTAWLGETLATVGTAKRSQKSSAGLSMLSGLMLNPTQLHPDKRAYFPLGLCMKGVSAINYSDGSGVVNASPTASEDDVMTSGFIYEGGELLETDGALPTLSGDDEDDGYEVVEETSAHPHTD